MVHRPPPKFLNRQEPLTTAKLQILPPHSFLKNIHKTYDSGLVSTLIRVVTYHTRSPTVCATLIFIMGSVMGQFPLRNGVLLVVAIRESALTNGGKSGNDNGVCRSLFYLHTCTRFTVKNNKDKGLPTSLSFLLQPLY